MNKVTTPSRSMGIKSSHSMKVQHQLQLSKPSPSRFCAISVGSGVTLAKQELSRFHHGQESRIDRDQFCLSQARPGKPSSPLRCKSETGKPKSARGDRLELLTHYGGSDPQRSSYQSPTLLRQVCNQPSLSLISLYQDHIGSVSVESNSASDRDESTLCTLDSSSFCFTLIHNRARYVLERIRPRVDYAITTKHTLIKVFMDDFTVYADSFDACLENLSKVLMRCIDINLVRNFEKCHFMVIEGIVLGHQVSNKGIKVEKSKIDIITSLPNPA
ncbi:Retrovirus-related Pol polyprotein, partial [Mucuna pruriens]